MEEKKKRKSAKSYKSYFNNVKYSGTNSFMILIPSSFQRLCELDF